MQLDCLLDSLMVNAPRAFSIAVLWRSTDFIFDDGYERCMELHAGVDWRHEDDFRAQTLALVGDDAPVCFFTDDDIVYRPVPPLPVLSLTWSAFSLRLGRNTRTCYPHNCEQTLPLVFRGSQEWCAWPWWTGDGDFGYPGSLDGHVMHGQQVLDIMRASVFHNPNTLEDVLMQGLASVSHSRVLAAFGESCVVSIPANRVTETHLTNRVWGEPSYAREKLAAAFVDGFRIDWPSMDFSDVHGAHQEIAYVLTEDAR